MRNAKLGNHLKYISKLSLHISKWFNAFQVLKCFLLLLDVTCVIFARATNTNVWQAIVASADRAEKWLRMRQWRSSRRLGAKPRLEQNIPNERSIVEKWRYFIDFLHDFQSFSFQRRFIYLRGIAFSRPCRWNFQKVRDIINFIDPLLRIVSLRAAFSRHGLLTSR